MQMYHHAMQTHPLDSCGGIEDEIETFGDDLEHKTKLGSEGKEGVEGREGERGEGGGERE